MASVPSFPPDLITRSDFLSDSTPVPVQSPSSRSFCRVFAAVCACFHRSSARVYETVDAREGNMILPGDSVAKGRKKMLVLDLDETLVHSALEPMEAPDVVFSVEVDDTTVPIYVAFRPGLHALLDCVSLHYEITVYTASVATYADPLLDLLDPKQLIAQRLFREDCLVINGKYSKDLLRFERKMSEIVIVDNSPTAYQLHKENAVPISSFVGDKEDKELFALAELLCDLAYTEDVRTALPELLRIHNEKSDVQS